MGFIVTNFITLFLLIGCIPQQQSKPSIPRCPVNETYNINQKKCILNNNLTNSSGGNSGSSGNSNSPVVGANQTLTAFEDSNLEFTVNKATDNDSTNLFYTLVSAPQNGAIFNCFDPTAPDSRNCTYVPNENFYGTDSLIYKVDDGTSSSRTNATITFTVTAQEDKPTIKDLDTNSYTSTSSYSLFNNDARTFLFKVDEGGGVLEDSENIYLIIKTTNKLTVPLDLIKLSYTGSNLNLTGLDSSLFIIPTPGSGNTQSAKIKLNDTSDASVGTLYFTLGLNERDGNTPFTANNITDNYKGTASVTIEVYDGVTATPTTKTLNLTLIEQNIPPVPPSPLSVSVNEDSYVNITVTPSSDLNVNNYLTYTPVALPSSGTLGECMGLNSSLTSDLTCVYTPAPNYFGSPQTFTYKTFDSITYSTTNGVITIYVTPINDAPTALFVSATATANEGSPATITYTIDEGGGAYEDNQILYINVTPSSTTVTPLERIGIYEGSTFRGNAATPTVTISDSATLNLIIDHADATPGSSTITLSLSDGSLIVNPSPVTIGFDGSTNVAPRLIAFLGTSSPTDNSLLTPVATAGEATPITVTFKLDEGGYGEDAEMVDISVTSGSPGVVPNNGTSLNINSSNSNSLVSTGEGATDLSTITTNNVVIDPTFGNPNFFGTIKFTLALTDTNASPLTATKYFNVKWYEINDPPTINANSDVTVSEGTPISAHALTVDEGGNVFENGQTLTLTIAITPAAITSNFNTHDFINNNYMSLTWGSQPLTYDPSRSNTTLGYWTYTVNDNSQNASSYSVLLNITPPKDATTHGTPVAIYTIVTDNGTTNGTPAPTPASDSFLVTINSTNDAPQITPVAATSSYTANLNTGIYGIEYYLDEGGSIYEDNQQLSITDVQSSDTAVIPLANIRFYYGPAATCGTYHNSLIFHNTCYIGDGSSMPIINIDAASTDAKSSKLFVDILANSTPQYGSSTVSFKISDGEVALDPTASISVTVNSRGFDHGGWRDVIAYGSKTNLAELQPVLLMLKSNGMLQLQLMVHQYQRGRYLKII
ncbi:MAG: Ig-like domain-containing protein [Bacteriovoracaceae bacterium]